MKSLILLLALSLFTNTGKSEVLRTLDFENGDITFTADGAGDIKLLGFRHIIQVGENNFVESVTTTVNGHSVVQTNNYQVVNGTAPSDYVFIAFKLVTQDRIVETRRGLFGDRTEVIQPGRNRTEIFLFPEETYNSLRFIDSQDIQVVSLSYSSSRKETYRAQRTGIRTFNYITRISLIVDGEEYDLEF